MATTKDKLNTIRDSADAAEVAMHAYADTTGTRQNGQYTDDLWSIVRDLLADIMHYCDREEVDLDGAWDAARDHYETEVSDAKHQG